MDDDDYNSEEEDYDYEYSDESGMDDDDDDDDSQNSAMGSSSSEMDSSVGKSDGISPRGVRRGRVSTGSAGGFDSAMHNDDSAIHMMDASELQPMMKRRITDAAELLNISPSAAAPLLRQFKWVKDRLFESYYIDSDKVQKASGVLARCNSNSGDRKPAGNICLPASKKATTNNCNNAPANRTCNICMDDEYTPDEMLAMPCGHEFCLDCWSGFLRSNISDGPSCILTTCPQAGCSEIVTEEEVSQAARDLLPKFQNYQLRNFVDVNGTSRWCPGPGCERIAAIPNMNSSLYDADSIIAACDSCNTKFCLKCGSEPHPPLRCASLDVWKEKCRNESETANWILANTKPCPKCRSRIEKNQGCNHMTCQNCKHEFCWICNGDWASHGANTGGYYNCNKFEENAEEDESDIAKAKRELDRYLHYYKRYHAHSEAQRFAQKQLDGTEGKMMILQDGLDNATWTDVEFLKAANEQLVDCRRVLKYTYVFAYYMTTPPKLKGDPEPAPEAKSKGSKKDGKKNAADVAAAAKGSVEDAESLRLKSNKDRFEYHQEMLERFTEILSELVEKKLEEIDRVQVVNQTRVVKNFMEKILEYVENGMDES